ncbi:MAG TPA: hypothetical protein VJM31_16285, partial [Vicinamibacterales bacterium]|nr:hypothetical protein [Vicinamibacterales bacterium]
MNAHILLSAWLLAVTLTVACGSNSVQQPASPPAQTAATPAAAPPLTYGQHHHPIRTSNADAQKMFDQGMAQAFGFNHEAAIKSFERAAQLDPSSPMPHWGRAWALGPNYNLDIDDARAKIAYDAIVQAHALDEARGKADDAETAYLEALSVRYSADIKADRP